MNHTEEKLGTESLGSLMLSMGIPTLVAQMINLLYNIVDRVYIGPGVGREALTGLGLALPAITIVSAFSALAGAGGAPLAAIALGQGDRKKAERITGNVFMLLCVFSAIVMLVFYAAQKPFLYLVGASDATYPYASEYLSIYLIGTICVQIVLGLNPFITAQGQSKVMQETYHRRLKLCPAFDDLNLIQAENQEFGTPGCDKMHFNPILAGLIEKLQQAFPEETKQYLEGYQKVADDQELARRRYLINPMNYIGTEERADMAPHYRIRVGSRDADTSLMITLTLALKLMQTKKTDVDYEIVWDEAHGRADYPGEVTEWVKEICK